MKRGELRQTETVIGKDVERIRTRGDAQSFIYPYFFEGLAIYRALRKDPVVESLQNLFTSLTEEKLNLRKVHENYYSFCAQATEKNWPEYLWDRVLEADNILTQQAGCKDWDNLDAGLKSLAAHDLKSLQRIAALQPEELRRMVLERIEEYASVAEEPGLEWLERPEQWTLWVPQQNGNDQDPSRAGQYLEYCRNHVKKILFSGTEEEAIYELAGFYRKIGSGLMATGMAFKWDGKEKALVRVKPDPICKEQLIGQEREQGILLENTEFFLAGYPSNNVILYGNRGTGKSSLVKALLQEYYEKGFRLVELSKRDLTDFPLMIRFLAQHPQRFILFIDDLSFEETELAYKALKTVLEGGVEKRPDNVLIYATSNRRHLIRENFTERQGDEVHVRDTLDEKLSLSDRFGITITFPSPDQAEYLKIVEELAAQEGLTADIDQLRQQALRWVMMHNARSGRTARQFIDYMVAQQKIKG
ncbi:ATP-binding protein [Desulfitobacterium sp. Sab5]|uniref:ATP-binding protein n=1 Tax=Desulfitobacterium nosdiversum TaxID=3375356 RepID=UPI003CEE5816